MEKLKRMNALSRYICKHTMSLEELQKSIENLENAKEYKKVIQVMAYPMISSFVTGILVVGLSSVGVGDSFDKIIIGIIMLLILGIALTFSIRDMIKGDIISGLLGLSEALLRATAIAMGFALVFIIRGGN